jgi:hypothetical protein
MKSSKRLYRSMAKTYVTRVNWQLYRSCYYSFTRCSLLVARCSSRGGLLIAAAMGSYLLFAGEEDTEAVQGAMVRVARSFHQESGVEQGERDVSVFSHFIHVRCVSDTR